MGWSLKALAAACPCRKLFSDETMAMDEKTQIVPFNEILESEVDLNLAIKQAQRVTTLLDAMGIEKATFRSGTFFHRDQKTGTATLASDGLIVQQRQHSTSITFRHDGSGEREAIEELAIAKGATQETLGSFSGKSQPWTSRALAHDDTEE